MLRFLTSITVFDVAIVENGRYSYLVKRSVDRGCLFFFLLPVEVKRVKFVYYVVIKSFYRDVNPQLLFGLTRAEVY